MKSNFLYIIVIVLIFSTNEVFAGRCTGKSNYKACTTCSSCKYCNSGGSCGVCSQGSGGGFGHLLLLGGGIVFVLWLFNDNSNERKK